MELGWMNDVLDYMSMDSYFRSYHHDEVTFSMCYAFSEHYILPLSHDEVVHGKKSLIGRMPGEYADKFSQTRLLLMYQMAHPGKKLTFMGTELAQFIEWNFRQSLDWLLLDYPTHEAMQQFVRELNHFYTRTRRCISWTTAGTASNGSPWTIGPTACWPSSERTPRATRYSPV